MAIRPAGGGIATPESAWRTRRDAWEHLGYALAQQVGNRSRGLDTPSGDDVIRGLLGVLNSLEPYWALPGAQTVDAIAGLVAAGRYRDALDQAHDVAELLRGTTVRPDGEPATGGEEQQGEGTGARRRQTVEVLVVDDGREEETAEFKLALLQHRRGTDAFRYEVNIVANAEDAVVALTINPGIQACVITPRFAHGTDRRLSSSLAAFIRRRLGMQVEASPAARMLELADVFTGLRPELDVYLMAGVALEALAGSLPGRIRRIFSRNDTLDLHLSILNGVAERYETPFFTALQEHSRRPGSVFHALPISRGGSVQNSPWISDLSEFYGMNLLLAETSATSGGLDSLLDPHGSLKEAQERAARAFGSHRTYFVTNGTSTANKIVHQSIVAPGDIVLVDRNCHKSHHYSLVLAGASVSYLEAYPLDGFSMYGAVPLAEIKGRLLALRRAGLLERVKMIALTNCTFDGIVYDPRRVMEECLAIKPDLVFLWDEAWFAFAAFHPVYRQRTAMQAAADLEEAFATPEYSDRHREQARELASGGRDEDWIRMRLVPDPRRARLRVYATQSTHKTLTSLRQGSMVHVFDQDFAALNEESFREAFMTHTSTSPNYQILASLDIGRRQAELEGYALVQKQVDLAVTIARTVGRHPLLRKYFRVLTTADLIPADLRQTQARRPERGGLAEWNEAWSLDEFVLDPSRLTLDISATGVDGDTFKHEYLMDGHSIQVNKTGRSSVLLMTNIGTSRSAAAYLLEVLVKIAEDFERRRGLEPAGAASGSGPDPATGVPLPDFSRFAERFQAGGGTGDVRSAYYLAGRQGTTEYLTHGCIRELGPERVVSAGFVTPYPPGFPVLVPGQVFTEGILDYMEGLDTREVHGYEPALGYRVFVPSALGSAPRP